MSKADEFKSTQQWAKENKMIVNHFKINEIVFHRHRLSKFTFNPAVSGIEIVHASKLLGVILSDIPNLEKQVMRNNFIML